MSDTNLTYMTDALGPLPFCPGCGHERVLKELNRALIELNVPITSWYSRRMA